MFLFLFVEHIQYIINIDYTITQRKITNIATYTRLIYESMHYILIYIFKSITAVNI